MTEKREVIRRLRLGHSIRQINRDTGMHRTLIREIQALSVMHDWLDSDTDLPQETELQSLLYALHKPPEEPEPHILDPYKDDIDRWLNEDKNSFVVIHELLRQEGLEISESTVRRYCHKHFPAASKLVFLRPTIPGEIMEVDFGNLGIVYDPQERRNRRAYVFSARLRHSRVAWREIVYSQSQSQFFRCHVHAFEYFGGVPEKVVPDNLKAAVIKASFTEPVINRVYHRLAEHYGFVIDPCPPYTPEFKGGVENDIKYIKRNFWPRYREKERRIGNESPSREGIQSALQEWSEEVHNRVIKGVGAPPAVLFQQEEQACLRLLPPSRWHEVAWYSAKVHETWRVQVNRAYYSVPYKFIGKTVQIFISDDQVEVYDNYELIATHHKAEHPWQAVLDPAHDPPNVREFLSTTRDGLVYVAGKIGPFVEAMVRQLIERKVADGLRPARALLRLARQYGAVRLDQACERALLYDRIEYVTVKRILVGRLDLEHTDTAVNAQGNYCFQFSRPAGYFDGQQSSVREVRA